MLPFSTKGRQTALDLAVMITHNYVCKMSGMWQAALADPLTHFVRLNCHIHVNYPSRFPWETKSVCSLGPKESLKQTTDWEETSGLAERQEEGRCYITKKTQTESSRSRKLALCPLAFCRGRTLTTCWIIAAFAGPELRGVWSLPTCRTVVCQTSLLEALASHKAEAVFLC